MANVVLKSDFRDGDLLFAQQLNNNFKAIQAALETMNKVMWQDNYDTVISFRGTTEEINVREIIDGQLLYNTTTGETFIDYEGKRINTGLGSVPAGSIIEFEGDIIPLGWEIVNENNDGSKTIKKVVNTVTVPAEIKNEKTTSDKDTYSCNYVNTCLNKLDKSISGIEGKFIYIYYDTSNGLEPGELTIDKLSEYARIDILCYKATDFDVSEGGIWETLDNTTSYVALTIYPYGDGSYTAYYVDYHNGSPRVFERPIRVASSSNKLIIGEGTLNGQTNKYIMVPHYFIGYKGNII